MEKSTREIVNATGRALYGATIVLLTEGKAVSATIIFLISLALILFSLRDDAGTDYIAMLLREITAVVAAASVVELVIGNIKSAAILVLIMFVANKAQAFLYSFFVKDKE